MAKPSIFHFNCPFCGAHPQPVPLLRFLDRWRHSSQADFDAILSFYGRILLNVREAGTRWHTKKFLQALNKVLVWLEEYPLPLGLDRRIDDERDRTRMVLVDCPFCLTAKGARPADRYFAVWANACRVQTANLLYEAGIIFFTVLRQLPRWATPDELGRIGDMLVLNQQTLRSVGLLECPFCGRYTTALYGDGSPDNPHRCRWCLDASGGGAAAVLSLEFGDDRAIRLRITQGSKLPERLSGGIVPRTVKRRRRGRREDGRAP